MFLYQGTIGYYNRIEEFYNTITYIPEGSSSSTTANPTQFFGGVIGEIQTFLDSGGNVRKGTVSVQSLLEGSIMTYCNLKIKNYPLEE